jgi:alpha-tubulin suppressor-like RCC1 family protein
MKTKLLVLFILILKNISLAQSVIAGGGSHSLFLCSNSNAMACGYNPYGALGSGTTTNSSNAIQVNGLNGIISVAGGKFHSLFIKNDGTAWASGQNNVGQLGDSTTSNRTTPVQVKGVNGIIGVAAGAAHSLFLKNDGTVWACGGNFLGALGDGTNATRIFPIQIGGLSGITAIAADESSSFFLKNDSTVWSCGGNFYGQLGDGTTINRSVPVQVNAITRIVALAQGCLADHTLFIRNDSTVWGCGHNNRGQLGLGMTTSDKTIPGQINGFNGIVGVASGISFSLFLNSNGTVWACGDNQVGQLGDGTIVERHAPVLVNGISGIIAIATLGASSLYLKNNGTVWASGENTYGQLGDGTNIEKHLPTKVIGLCNVSIGINENYINDLITLYPNPANSYFSIETNSIDKQTLDLFDVNGRHVFSKIINGNTNIDATNLDEGIYTMKITTNEGIINKKLVIVR